MIKILVKYKYVFLILVILLTIFACFNISSIKINTDFSQFLSDDDPEYEFFKNLKTEIKDDESIIIIGVRQEPSIYNKAFIRHVESFTDSLEQIETIKNITSINTLSYPAKSFFGLMNIPYLELKDSTDIISYKPKIEKDFKLTQNFTNKEGTILLIWIELKANQKIPQIEKTLNSINKTRNEFSELETFLWGKSYLQYSLNEITKKETKKFVIWALVFLILTLSFIFNDPKAVLLSILLVVISFIMFSGGMVLFNRPFGMMANLFPTVILIVGISDLIHMSIKYDLELNRKENANDAIYTTINEIGWAILITSFTTAIGFFILYLSPMKVLRDFGLEAGIAVILTFLITLFLIPNFFQISKHKNLFALHPKFVKFSTRLINRIEYLKNYPKPVLLFFSAIFLIGCFGVSKINTNNLQFSIPNKSDLKKNYAFFEQQFGGSRTFELALIAKNDHRLNDPKILDQINTIHNYLDSLPYLNAVKSPILYYRAIHKAYKYSFNDNMPLKLDEKSINTYEKHLNTVSNTSYLMNKDKTFFKVSAQMKDLGRMAVAKRNDEILAHINDLIDNTVVSARITGIDYLFDRAHEQRINNMIYGLLIAILIVGITLGMIFKNLSITVLALLLNIIPIVICAGIMGFTNLELRSGTSIIFTLAFVIAVDDTIHLLSKFQWERKQGNSIEEAIQIAIQECGKAILATSIILIGGFFILMLSDFPEIFTLGFLMGVIIIITLCVDLILAPILMLTWFKKYL